MAFVPASQTAMAELRMLYSTQRIENTLYFQASAALTVTLMQSLGAALVGWWNTNVRPQVSNLLVLNEIFITDLTTQTSPTVSHTSGLPLVGADTGEALPFNCAFCVSFRTAGRGKSSRGRNYVAGMTENDTVRNDIQTTFSSPILSAYQLLIGAGTFVAGLQWCVVSRFANNAPRVSALVQPITAVVAVDLTVDSQRRRLPGRGN